MTASSARAPDGADLLAQEIREEAVRLASHPIREIGRLGHVAAEGESATTPMLVALGVVFAVGFIFAVVCAATMLVYYAQ